MRWLTISSRPKRVQSQVYGCTQSQPPLHQHLCYVCKDPPCKLPGTSKETKKLLAWAHECRISHHDAHRDNGRPEEGLIEWRRSGEHHPSEDPGADPVNLIPFHKGNECGTFHHPHAWRRHHMLQQQLRYAIPQSPRGWSRGCSLPHLRHDRTWNTRSLIPSKITRLRECWGIPLTENFLGWYFHKWSPTEM